MAVVWVSAENQVVDGISYRVGDQYQGKVPPGYQPDGVWHERKLPEDDRAWSDTPMATSARGRMSWLDPMKRRADPAPVVQEWDLLRGRPVIDKVATQAAKERADRAYDLERLPVGLVKPPQPTPEERWAREQELLAQERQEMAERAANPPEPRSLRSHYSLMVEEARAKRAALELAKKNAGQVVAQADADQDTEETAADQAPAAPPRPPALDTLQEEP